MPKQTPIEKCAADLSETTLLVLLSEAKANEKSAKRLFDKWDNVEDMHDWKRWTATIVWLEGALKKTRVAADQ